MLHKLLKNLNLSLKIKMKKIKVLLIIRMSEKMDLIALQISMFSL